MMLVFTVHYCFFSLNTEH